MILWCGLGWEEGRGGNCLPMVLLGGENPAITSSSREGEPLEPAFPFDKDC